MEGGKNEKNLKQAKGITLIALVVTVIVLLILAGVSIRLVKGRKGILGRALEARTQTRIAREVEELKIAASIALTDNVTNNHINVLTYEALLNELYGEDENGEYAYPNIMEVSPYQYVLKDEDIKYNLSLNEKPNILENLFMPVSYGTLVWSGGEAADVQIDRNMEYTDEIIYAKIVFESKREYLFGLEEHYGEVYLLKNEKDRQNTDYPYLDPYNPNLPYGPGDDEEEKEPEEYEDESYVFDESNSEFKIGDYVNYEVSYTDMYTGYEFTSADGWRILNPNAVDENGNEVVDIISTGIPAQLYYNYDNIKTNSWAKNADRNAYSTKFYSSNSNDNENMYGSAGMYYNLADIEFISTTDSINQNGKYTKINGQTGTIKGSEFIKGNATSVHTLTLTELNKVRNSRVADGELFYKIKDNKKKGKEFASKITSESDPALGLFYLKDLEDFDYGKEKLYPYYWLSSPRTDSPQYIWYVSSGSIYASSVETYGIRPVVSIPKNKFNLKKSTLRRLSSQISAENYGDKVTNYTVDGESDWRIFYKDEDNNIFLILTDYLPASKIPDASGILKKGKYKACWDDNKTFPITELTNAQEKFIYSWMIDWEIDKSRNNYKIASALLDTVVWKKFANDEKGFGESAIGTPTLEMWVKSWNAKYPSDGLVYDSNYLYGYRIGKESDKLVSTSLDNDVISGMTGYKDVPEENNMYFPHKAGIPNEDGTCWGYWMAAPTSYSANGDLMYVYAKNGRIGNRSYRVGNALRPVVSLKSYIKGTSSKDKDGNTVWTLSN